MRNRLLVTGLTLAVAITGGYIWRKRRKGG